MARGRRETQQKITPEFEAKIVIAGLSKGMAAAETLPALMTKVVQSLGADSAMTLWTDTILPVYQKKKPAITKEQEQAVEAVLFADNKTSEVPVGEMPVLEVAKSAEASVGAGAPEQVEPESSKAAGEGHEKKLSEVAVDPALISTVERALRKLSLDFSKLLPKKSYQPGERDAIIGQWLLPVVDEALGEMANKYGVGDGGFDQLRTNLLGRLNIGTTGKVDDMAVRQVVVQRVEARGRLADKMMGELRSALLAVKKDEGSATVAKVEPAPPAVVATPEKGVAAKPVRPSEPTRPPREKNGSKKEERPARAEKVELDDRAKQVALIISQEMRGLLGHYSKELDREYPEYKIPKQGQGKNWQDRVSILTRRIYAGVFGLLKNLGPKIGVKEAMFPKIVQEIFWHLRLRDYDQGKELPSLNEAKEELVRASRVIEGNLVREGIIAPQRNGKPVEKEGVDSTPAEVELTEAELEHQVEALKEVLLWLSMQYQQQIVGADKMTGKGAFELERKLRSLRARWLREAADGLSGDRRVARQAFAATGLAGDVTAEVPETARGLTADQTLLVTAQGRLREVLADASALGTLKTETEVLRPKQVNEGTPDNFSLLLSGEEGEREFQQNIVAEMIIALSLRYEAYLKDRFKGKNRDKWEWEGSSKILAMRWALEDASLLVKVLIGEGQDIAVSEELTAKASEQASRKRVVEMEKQILPAVEQVTKPAYLEGATQALRSRMERARTKADAMIEDVRGKLGLQISTWRQIKVVREGQLRLEQARGNKEELERLFDEYYDAWDEANDDGKRQAVDWQVRLVADIPEAKDWSADQMAIMIPVYLKQREELFSELFEQVKVAEEDLGESVSGAHEPVPEVKSEMTREEVLKKMPAEILRAFRYMFGRFRDLPVVQDTFKDVWFKGRREQAIARAAFSLACQKMEQLLGEMAEKSGWHFSKDDLGPAVVEIINDPGFKALRNATKWSATEELVRRFTNNRVIYDEARTQLVSTLGPALFSEVPTISRVKVEEIEVVPPVDAGEVDIGPEEVVEEGVVEPPPPPDDDKEDQPIPPEAEREKKAQQLKELVLEGARELFNRYLASAKEQGMKSKTAQRAVATEWLLEGEDVPNLLRDLSVALSVDMTTDEKQDMVKNVLKELGIEQSED